MVSRTEWAGVDLVTRRIREVRDSDWPEIAALANQSVAHVPGAGDQDEWLANRRRPNASRRHFVVEGPAGIESYAAAEVQPDQGARLFLVTAPERREDLAPLLYARLCGELTALCVREAWFIEYADDADFIAYLSGLGFRETRRFALESGSQAVVLSRRFAAGEAG